MRCRYGCYVIITRIYAGKHTVPLSAVRGLPLKLKSGLLRNPASVCVKMALKTLLISKSYKRSAEVTPEDDKLPAIMYNSVQNVQKRGAYENRAFHFRGEKEPAGHHKINQVVS